MSAPPPPLFFFVLHNSDWNIELNSSEMSWTPSTPLHLHSLNRSTIVFGQNVSSSGSKMISIQLRHHFLFTPLFPFFPPFSLHEVWSRSFFPQTQKKKNQIRGCTGRKRPEQEWISETNCPADANRRVGLLFQMIPCFISWATETLRSFWKGLQHLWIVCLVRKERTIFLFVFSVVLFDSWAEQFPDDVLISCKSISANGLMRGRSRSSQPECRMWTPLPTEGASASAQMRVVQRQQSDWRVFTDATAAVWWHKKSQKWDEGMSLRRWLLGGMLWTRICSYVSLHNGVKNKIMTKWCIPLHEQRIPVVQVWCSLMFLHFQLFVVLFMWGEISLKRMWGIYVKRMYWCCVE